MREVSVQQRVTALCLVAFAGVISIPALAAYERDVVNPLLERAEAHVLHHEWDAAIAASNAAIARDPFRSIAYVYRGYAYEEMDQDEAALRDFDQAWSLNSGSAEMFNAKGWLYYREGYLVAAIDHYNIALHIDPDQPAYYYNLALALDDYGYPEGAALNFHRFLDRYPHDDAYSQHARERIKGLEG